MHEFSEGGVGTLGGNGVRRGCEGDFDESAIWDLRSVDGKAHDALTPSGECDVSGESDPRRVVGEDKNSLGVGVYGKPEDAAVFER